jgi:hypothetical protein
MALIAGELVSDAIGREVQNDENVYSVFRKMAELHQIEEGRHIYFAKKYLEAYTKNAGLLRRTVYSMMMAIHIHFMITMYVKEEIFERAGVPNARQVYKAARKNYRLNFSTKCLQSAIDYTKEFNGFNAVSKLFWKWLLKAQIN